MTRNNIRIIVALLCLIVGSVSSSADDEAAALKVFDALCVSSSLDKDRFVANARFLDAKKMSEKLASGIGDHSNLAYGLIVEGTPFVATIGSKRGATGFVSKNCTVSSKGFSFTKARKVFEQNYAVREVKNMRQGLNVLKIYLISLVGQGHKKFAASIQHQRAAGNAVTWSLFERE